MTDTGTRNSYYVLYGLLLCWLIAVDWLCPLIARHTGSNAHDLHAVCMLGFLVGMWITGALLHVNPRVSYRWWVTGLWILLLGATAWVLFRSRTWTQLSADIVQHPAIFITSIILAIFAGMAVLLAQKWAATRLWPQPPAPTPTDN